MYEDVANGIKDMLACTNTSDRYSTVFGIDDLNHGMLKVIVVDSSVGGCAKAQALQYSLFDRRYASAIREIEQNTVQHAFEDKI